MTKPLTPEEQKKRRLERAKELAAALKRGDKQIGENAWQNSGFTYLAPPMLKKDAEAIKAIYGDEEKPLK